MPYRTAAAAQNPAHPVSTSQATMNNVNLDEGGDGRDVEESNSKNITPARRIPAERLNNLAQRDVSTEAGIPRKLPPSYSTNSFNVTSTSRLGGLAPQNVQRTASKSTLTSRRRQSTAVDVKTPMGPRPLDYSNSKRSVSNSTVQQPFHNIHGTSAIASQNPYTNELSINDISRFSFASINSKGPAQDDPEAAFGFGNFLEPTFNFDELHDNLSLTEPSLNHFPLPGGTGAMQRPQAQENLTKQEEKIASQNAISIPARKPTSSVILNRKGSTASSKSSRISVKSDSISNGLGPILKGRRQSQFPPNSFNNSTGSKAPRKSIGPGTFVAPDVSDQPIPKRNPSVGNKKLLPEGQGSLLTSKAHNRGTDGAADRANSTRTVKAKSFLAPSKSHSKELSTPSRTPDPPRAPSSNTLNTPNRRNETSGRATMTPATASSSNKRMSVMPHHATGLGARTVSPTDARRMKRMSTVPPAPPLPHQRISQAPPTPQPDSSTPMRPRSTAQSPGAANRKSLTPSSSRTTPDPNRKSYSSGQSLSSNTSYNSASNPGSAGLRLSQNLNSSRLPTPKPRLDTSNTSNYEGEVPPVPAIPKAYESPGSEMDQPFFSARSSSLPPVDTPIPVSPLVTNFADAMKTLETPRAPSSSSRMSAGLQTDSEVKPNKQTKINKKTGQTLRLPPINLLPLSTPTTSKIQSLKDSKHELPDTPATPPPHRNNMKTPSTPMTASKASFFSRSHRGPEEIVVIRSSTSHNAHSAEERRLPSTSSPSLPPFSFETEPESARNISPFVSTSLPKSSTEFANFMRPNFTTELNRTTIQPKPNGPRAPSYSITPKAEENRFSLDSPADSDLSHPSSSMSTKSSRKVNETVVLDTVDDDLESSKFDNMPPPKLPASASWTNQLSLRSSPIQKATNYLRSRRQTSESSSHTAPEGQGSFDSSITHTSKPSLESNRSLTIHANRSGSVSSVGPSPLNNKTSQLRLQDSVLDRDDLLAEEEMKRLASKRKDFESAARELDSLRARARPVQRMSAATATKLCDLNIFERGEIVDFVDVYFTGTRNARKIIGDLTPGSSNFGYDDERGDYNIVPGDHLVYRYEVVDLLGKGSFGQVVRCIDHKTGILVAVKIIRNKKRFHQQALVEVNILQKLREWDPSKKHSVINFDQEFYFRGHLCISTDLLGMNLYEFIKAYDFRGFSLKLIRRFTKQLLNSLVLLHKHKVIHCDLKPENILLAHPVHSEIKVIDFGSSCFENEKVYTYIQSRFYRSPEVILGMSYGMPIDMWSVGCILAELHTGYPIFPGENEQEQLACIMEVFGPPEKHLIEKSTRRKLFFDSMGKPRLTVSSKGRRRRPSSKELRQVLKCEDEAFLDFISRCLRWDPSKRMNPHEAIKHDFITGNKMALNPPRKNLASVTNSPVKRVNSINTAGVARPLPQPPSTNLKLGVGPRQDQPTQSPSKGVGPRRQSNMHAVQATMQAKRASHVAMTQTASNSSLNSTRTAIAQRNMTNRTDLAAAAAAASLVK